MKQYDKLTFVSHSDTCRGPMAEALIQDKLLLEDILIDSKGMIVLFPEPVNPKAQEVLKERGISVETHEAAQLTADDFDERTLILTMEERQKTKLLDEYGENALNVYTLAEYCGVSGDVYNPLGKDIPEYRHCLQILRELTAKTAAVIKEENE